MAASTSSKRRRGGQPGNRNALKYGFYAAQSPSLPSYEESPLAFDLQTEIALIRQSMQRVLTLGEPQTYREAVDYLRALSLASTALTRLVRTHRYLFPPPDPRDELTNSIKAALKEIGEQIEAGEFPTDPLRRRPHPPRPRPPRRFRRRASHLGPRGGKT
jgi:hypothetical protein